MCSSETCKKILYRIEKIDTVAKYYLECKNFSVLIQNDIVGLSSGFFQQALAISVNLENVSLGQNLFGSLVETLLRGKANVVLRWSSK